MPDQVPAAILDDILKRAHQVEARANALADEMIGALESVRHAILAEMARLQERYLTTDDWSAETYARKSAYLQAQREAVDALISDVYAGMGEKVRDAALDVIQTTEAASTALLASFPSSVDTFIKAGAAGISASLLADWVKTQTIDGLLINEWLAKMGRATADRVVAAGRESLIMGYGVRKTASLMRAQGIEGSVPGLEALARTFLLSASNYAREASITRLTEDSDLLKGWKYVATLDGRTCPICGADDGKFFPVDKTRPRLQRHINCRCTYVPVTKTWRDFGIDRDELPPPERPAVKHEARTVHHRDGSSSTRFKVADVEHTTENYNQWLTRQLKEDPAFVRSILGKTRFDLFKAGKITLDKMVVGNRIKRLSELSK
ncbi:minor capsid protein [Desulfovibrio porci]|uniref:minor capsid protein n=1 Tax=Desulfovibrio porci TaxID=2605782 RepID=UPI002A81AABF|nr:minor capsid protein [Desulfovibrio porci]MDY3810997.1 minor capsid protein [Desulfovibrio porci]